MTRHPRYRQPSELTPPPWSFAASVRPSEWRRSTRCCPWKNRTRCQKAVSHGS